MSSGHPLKYLFSLTEPSGEPSPPRVHVPWYPSEDAAKLRRRRPDPLIRSAQFVTSVMRSRVRTPGRDDDRHWLGTAPR